MPLAATNSLPGLTGAVNSPPRRNRDLTLHRYLLLQEEHETVRRHLDELSSDTCDTCSTVTTHTTPSPTALSPTRASAFGQQKGHFRRASMDAGAPRPRNRVRSGRRGLGSDPDPEVALDATALAEVLSEEAKLCSINEGIKRSLTELLNCETVRCDQAFRQWIMGRLLEVEKELRSGRRRRSCPSDSC